MEVITYPCWDLSETNKASEKKNWTVLPTIPRVISCSYNWTMAVEPIVSKRDVVVLLKVWSLDTYVTD